MAWPVPGRLCARDRTNNATGRRRCRVPSGHAERSCAGVGPLPPALRRRHPSRRDSGRRLPRLGSSGSILEQEVGILLSVRRGFLALIAFLCLALAPAALPAIPTPPAGSLPGMQSRARPLPSTVLAAEVIDHAGLRRVLERGGYAGGNEREFYGKTEVFNHVTEQVLRFGSAAGAASYLSWLRAHSAQSLGAPRSIAATRLSPGGFIYRPQGCGCHTETPTYLIAWRHGNLALTVLASGAGASPGTVTALARRLDGAAA